MGKPLLIIIEKKYFSLRIHKREEREFELTFRMDTLFDGESELDKMTFKKERHCECVCVSVCV